MRVRSKARSIPLINLPLFGISFTIQPRVITMRDFEDPVGQAFAGFERTKTFVLENLRRVVQEQNTIRERFDEAGSESDQEAGLSKRSVVFRDRGISVDTTILSSFGIEAALRDMKDRAVLQRDR